jgi:hypothetical protein
MIIIIVTAVETSNLTKCKIFINIKENGKRHQKKLNRVDKENDENKDGIMKEKTKLTFGT